MPVSIATQSQLGNRSSFMASLAAILPVLIVMLVVLPMQSPAHVRAVALDFNQDGATDIAVLGSPNFHTDIPFLTGSSTGGFISGYATLFTAGYLQFPNWSMLDNAQPVVGGFSGYTNPRLSSTDQHLGDIALLGSMGLLNIPILHRLGGTTIQNPIRTPSSSNRWSNFAVMSQTPGVTSVTGDFDGDGYTDIALLGGQGWKTIPIAYGSPTMILDIEDVSIEDGQVPFPVLAGLRNVKAVAGDFDGDGLCDLALTGGKYWTKVHLLRSVGRSHFVPFNPPAPVFDNGNPNFATMAGAPGVQVVVGDFDGNGGADLALVGINMAYVPILFSQKNGLFVENAECSFTTCHYEAAQMSLGAPTADAYGFMSAANLPGVKALAGNFDGDAYTDIALIGGAGWKTTPVFHGPGPASLGVCTNGYTYGTQFNGSGVEGIMSLAQGAGEGLPTPVSTTDIPDKDYTGPTPIIVVPSTPTPAPRGDPGTGNGSGNANSACTGDFDEGKQISVTVGQVTIPNVDGPQLVYFFNSDQKKDIILCPQATYTFDLSQAGMHGFCLSSSPGDPFNWPGDAMKNSLIPGITNNCGTKGTITFKGADVQNKKIWFWCSMWHRYMSGSIDFKAP